MRKREMKTSGVFCESICYEGDRVWVYLFGI